LKELALLFLKLGTIGFGGPAAHIAMMEDEVVRRRKWMSADHFLDLLSATNLIPGPNSTEMAIHIGYQRGGWKGLIVAGASFILPAVTITLLLARLYVLYGSLPHLQPFLSGIHPAIIAVILTAVFRLGRSVSRKPVSAALGVMVVVLNMVGIDEILLLLVSGLLGLLWSYRHKLLQSTASLLMIPSFLNFQSSGTPAVEPIATLAGLGWFFLKIGSMLYGSGYVLVAFLQGGLVDTRHWLTQSQLFDAIAIGQFTPGPVLSTATFIGYLILGVPGSTVATFGIFIPSFIFVLLSSPFIPRLRKSPLASGFLDGVNAASVGLMLAVTIKLALMALSGWGPWVILLVASALVLRWNINAAWIVLGSAILGWLFHVLTQ